MITCQNKVTEVQNESQFRQLYPDSKAVNLFSLITGGELWRKMTPYNQHLSGCRETNTQSLLSLYKMSLIRETAKTIRRRIIRAENEARTKTNTDQVIVCEAQIQLLVYAPAMK